MKCQICGIEPRAMWLFGGGYWHALFTDHWLCPSCYYWAQQCLGQKNLLPLR